MAYDKQRLQIHNTIKQSGNNTQVELITPLAVDKFSGVATGELVEKVFVTQVQHLTEDLADPAVAAGTIKLLVSPLDEESKPVSNFVKMLKDKKSTIRFPNSSGKISIKHAKVTIPDGITPLLCRIYIGG